MRDLKTLRLVCLAAVGFLAACSPAGLLNASIATRDLTIVKDVAYAPGPRHGLDIYRPASQQQHLPLIVFIYGGNWRTGDKDMYPFVAATLARRGAVVMVPNYRLFPEVAFPAFVQDNAAAVAWARDHAAAYGADPGPLFVMGHSAGAYNAVMLGLDPQWLAEVGMKPAELAGVIGLAGPYDFLPVTDPDVIPVFAPVQDGPLSQPITFADGHNPPMFLAAGSADTTVNPRNTEALASKIARLGGPVQSTVYPGVGHIGIIIAFAPLFSGKAPVANDVWAFVQAHLASAPALDAAVSLR